MKTREEIILVIKDICKENKDINLSIGEIGSALWKGKNITDLQWKKIGYVSALSFAFEIKNEEL